MGVAAAKVTLACGCHDAISMLCCVHTHPLCGIGQKALGLGLRTFRVKLKGTGPGRPVRCLFILVWGHTVEAIDSWLGVKGVISHSIISREK